jgi:serine/threonine-protein kinase HipA
VAPVVEAEVRLHGRPVGILRYDKGGSRFTYTDDLTAADHRPLGQVFEDDPRTVRRVRVGVPAWFANLLPEGEMRRQVERDLGGPRVGDFTLLTRLGTHLPGAVGVHADREPVGDLPVTPDATGPDHPLRPSLAGMQLKYSVRSERLTFPASGDGGWWIVKLPDRSLRDLPSNEFLTMSWLRRAGFDVPLVRLERAATIPDVPEGLVDPDELVYLIDRFDRRPEGRVHVEDFAQVADVPPQMKYGDSGATYDGLAAAVLDVVGDAGYEDFVRRLVAMILVGNMDAHLKNWAFRYGAGGEAGLAPVYDFHSHTVYSRYQFNALALSLNGEVMAAHLGTDDFRRLAEHAGADPERTVDVVRRAVHDLRTAWSDGARAETDRSFPALAKHFEQRLGSMPIAIAAD